MRACEQKLSLLIEATESHTLWLAAFGPWKELSGLQVYQTAFQCGGVWS